MTSVTLEVVKSVPMVGRGVEGIGIGGWFDLVKSRVCGLGSSSLFHAMAQ